MIYAWRHPQSIHRSVMIGVNPPGQLPLGREDDRRADPPLRRAVRRGRRLPQAHRRPRRHAARDRRPTSRAAGGSCRSSRATCGSPRSTASWSRRPTAAPLSAPMTLDALARRRQGRRERALAPCRCMADLVFPKSFVWGDVAAAARSRRRRRASATSRRHARRGSIIGDPGTEFLWAGGRLADAWPAKPGENEYTRVRTRASRRC